MNLRVRRPAGASTFVLRIYPVADKWTHLDDILVGEGLVGFVVLGVLEENLVHVGARVLVQLVARAEDNQRDLAVAQHRQFVRLLHHAEFPLVKGHLSHNEAEMSIIEGELVSCFLKTVETQRD